MNAAVVPLRLEDTVEVSRVGHRLALGVQWLDANMQLPASGVLVTELEALGSRPLAQRLELHPLARHAVRWAGRVGKLLEIAAEEKDNAPPADPADDPTNFVLRCYAQRGLPVDSYRTDQDPRRYVPRRLALTPAQTGGEPPVALDNVRQAWLWPGAAYPLGANATALRGCIRRGADLATADIVPWGRVVVTRPMNIHAPPNFAQERQVGWAHGDDRGEFLVLLGADAVPGGAALPVRLPLRVWVFLPPANGFDPDQPLASLPLEQAGGDRVNGVLRGLTPPEDYVRQAAVSLPLPSGAGVRPGEVFVMNDDVLLFP